jgi:hypothetical protein
LLGRNISFLKICQPVAERFKVVSMQLGDGSGNAETVKAEQQPFDAGPGQHS